MITVDAFDGSLRSRMMLLLLFASVCVCTVCSNCSGKPAQLRGVLELGKKLIRSIFKRNNCQIINLILSLVFGAKYDTDKVKIVPNRFFNVKLVDNISRFVDVKATEPRRGFFFFLMVTILCYGLEIQGVFK